MPFSPPLYFLELVSFMAVQQKGKGDTQFMRRRGCSDFPPSHYLLQLGFNSLLFIYLFISFLLLLADRIQIK
jgi:hypothetical protein